MQKLKRNNVKKKQIKKLILQVFGYSQWLCSTALTTAVKKEKIVFSKKGKHPIPY
jgi:hypothetical protein